MASKKQRKQQEQLKRWRKRQGKRAGEVRDFTLPPATLVERTMREEFGPVAAPDDPRAAAQELAYDALEAPNASEARRLAARALELDPECVDALLLQAR